ncbi:MAG: hypothetical protein EOP77_00225 [Variovorax sp.]|nr:MAG: hypothetical protein EOP77_00225 [Variovorax sp.]
MQINLYLPGQFVLIPAEQVKTKPANRGRNKWLALDDLKLMAGAPGARQLELPSAGERAK